MLAEGYIALVCQLAGPRVPAWGEDLDQVCARIATGGFEDGAEWIEQLRTARLYFSASRTDVSSSNISHSTTDNGKVP